MARDLGLKFAGDLRALVDRSVSIMGEELGRDETAGIIMSSLAAAGVFVQMSANAATGSFVKIAKATEGVFGIKEGIENERNS